MGLGFPRMPAFAVAGALAHACGVLSPLRKKEGDDGGLSSDTEEEERAVSRHSSDDDSPRAEEEEEEEGEARGRPPSSAARRGARLRAPSASPDRRRPPSAGGRRSRRGRRKAAPTHRSVSPTRGLGRHLQPRRGRRLRVANQLFRDERGEPMPGTAALLMREGMWGDLVAPEPTEGTERSDSDNSFSDRGNGYLDVIDQADHAQFLAHAVDSDGAEFAEEDGGLDISADMARMATLRVRAQAIVEQQKQQQQEASSPPQSGAVLGVRTRCCVLLTPCRACVRAFVRAALRPKLLVDPLADKAMSPTAPSRRSCASRSPCALLSLRPTSARSRARSCPQQ